MNYKGLFIVFLIIFLLTMSTVAATCNVIVITDPTGKDPNGAAAGSMSYATNMFQVTFLMSKEHHFAVLSGGTGTYESRTDAIVAAVAALTNGASVSDAASLANQFNGTRLVVGGPEIGAAISGNFEAYLIVVNDADGSITVTPYNSGVVVLQPGQKGGIIHLRNTEGNPQYGTAESVRKEAALNIGRMIRDGYPSTTIVARTMGEIANDSGEGYGGGAVNLVSGISTSDMFTPQDINETGFPMVEIYSVSCKECGWATGGNAASTYQHCPICGGELRELYAYEALENTITVSQNTVSVSTYGCNRQGLQATTSEIVKSAVTKDGYDSSAIAEAINKAINSGLLVGVNYVEPKDINVKPGVKAVGVYYTPLTGDRTSPSWGLPVDSLILNILGSIQTIIGIILILLVIFRSRLLKSFQNR